MTHDKVVIALDVGTTGIRAQAFSRRGTVVAESYQKLTMNYPQPGWVEQDPLELYHKTLVVLKSVVDQVGVAAVATVGIANQRETVLVWERVTGEPVYPAIVWQDRRTTAWCDQHRVDNICIKEKTGLILDPYFSASKLAWILDRVDPTRARSERGDLLFGTPDTWIIWMLSEKMVHVTEPSNASRTMLFNITTLDWDDELLKQFNIPRTLLPDVMDSDMLFGCVDSEICGGTIPITGILGDQQASLFGQMAWREKQAKATYGTGIFLLANTGSRIVATDNLIATVAWRRSNEVCYALEGSLFMGGASVQWLQENLGIIDSPADTDTPLIAAAENQGVYFVPAFQGLGAPYWDPGARGLIMGLTRKADRTTIIRAAVESMAYQVHDVFSALRTHLGMVDEFRVDGGATANKTLMQFQADLFGLPVKLSGRMEGTAFGVAGIAGIAFGFWSEKEYLALQTTGKTYTPGSKKQTAHAAANYAGWRDAVARSRGGVFSTADY